MIRKMKSLRKSTCIKRLLSCLVIILFVSSISMACTGLKGGGDSEPGKCKKCATPEPGTYIDRRALLIVKNANQFAKNPNKSLKVTSRLSKLIELKVREVIDTTIYQDSLHVPLRYYYPKEAVQNKPAPVIYYIHGGAFIYGGIEVYDMLMRKLARETGCIIVSVEYRLAPKYPFPAGLNDSYAAFKWVAAHAAEFGGDPNNITIMGDSAGGNLAAGTVLKSITEHGPRIARQVLMYPSTTFADTLYPSREYFGGRYSEPYLLSEDLMKEVKESYTRPGDDFSNPYISPLFADITPDFPPALIITSQCDPLRDEGHLYADKLSKAGVKVNYHMYEGMIHGFVSFYSLLPQGKDAIEEVSIFVRQDR